MRSRVSVTVGSPSVCLSRRSTAAAACGWLAAELGRGQQTSIDSCGCRVPAIDRYLLQAPAPAAAIAGSVMLRSEGRGSTQTCALSFDARLTSIWSCRSRWQSRRRSRELRDGFSLYLLFTNKVA